jgi:release factor glutamine methyltransferase
VKSNQLSKRSNKPKQYIEGWVEFYKLRLRITPEVLIPRPETELIVDELLTYLNRQPISTPTIIDIGTGSGNIAISLIKNNPNLKIIAADISQEALKVARLNAKLHGVINKIQFVHSDLLNNIDCTHFSRSSDMQSLVIVANLPYIPTSRIPQLNSSVRDFEPFIALDGGVDGFNLYRKLFQQIKKLKLMPNLILGEIEYTQKNLAAIEAKRFFPYARIEVKADLAHKYRILKILL